MAGRKFTIRDGRYYYGTKYATQHRSFAPNRPRYKRGKPSLASRLLNPHYPRTRRNAERKRVHRLFHFLTIGRRGRRGFK